MAEWTNAPALRAGGLTASWVQIPVPPPLSIENQTNDQGGPRMKFGGHQEKRIFYTGTLQLIHELAT
jgi:hypothetical protein